MAAGDVMRDALAASLSARGFAVDAHESLRAFFDSALRQQTHCLVADLDASPHDAGERDVFELREGLNAHGLSLPMILLSGLAKMARGGLALQPNLSILIKPVDPAYLAGLALRLIQGTKE